MKRTSELFASGTLALSLFLGLSGAACADIVVPEQKVRAAKSKPAPQALQVPDQKPVGRDATALARRDPNIAAMLEKARAATGGPEQNPPQPNPGPAAETAVEVRLGESCGFAGCGSTTLVAFTFRTRGANTQAQTVLSLVTCGPIQSQPCKVEPAEVRSTAQPAQR